MFGEEKVKNIFKPDYEDWKKRFGDDEEDEDEDVHEDGEECRYCDNDDCLYGGYIYDEELEKHKGKSYICIGCSTGVSLQEQEQRGIELII